MDDAAPPVVLTRAQAVSACRDLAAAGARRIIGITGAPGSGKSTFARHLADTLGGRARVLAMDGFHLADEVLSALGRKERKGAPDTFDVAGYVAMLRRLRAVSDDVVYAPQFDRARELAVAGAGAIPARVPVVITEGNYLLLRSGGWEGVRPLLDAVWYLDVPADVLRGRLISRRISYGDDPAAAQDWVERVDLPNARIIERSRAAADALIR